MSSEDITANPQPDPLPSAITPQPTPEAAAVPPPRFDAQPYAPEGSAPPLGLALTLGGGLAAAVLAGLLAGFIGQWFYLVILFPAAIGLVLGGVGMAFIRAGKLRNPFLAGIAAVLSGIMAMGTMHYFAYQRALSEVAEKENLPRDQLENEVSFAQFMDIRATQGVTISRAAAHNDKGMNLGYVGSYIYWLLEMAGVAGIAWGMMRKEAANPFCVTCNSWKEERPLALLVVPDENEAVRAVNEGDAVALLACPRSTQAQGHLLQTAVCPHCAAEGEVDISLARVTKNAKGEQEMKTLTRMTYPGEVLPYLHGDGAA